MRSSFLRMASAPMPEQRPSAPDDVADHASDCHASDHGTTPVESPEDGAGEPRESGSRSGPPIHPKEAADLVRKTLDGDLAAFEELVLAYQRAIFNIAYYKSRNLFDAEDLAQDIFLAAYNALPTLKDLENFGGWLIGIAHNRCHKWFRRERTKVVKFRELRERKEREERLRARGAADDADDAQRISREIRELPHEIARVLVLKYLEGMSYEAIEARLGIKPYRIDYLIRKGKSLLKRRLERRLAR